MISIFGTVACIKTGVLMCGFIIYYPKTQCYRCPVTTHSNYNCTFYQSWAFATFYPIRYSATFLNFAIRYSLLPLTSLMGFIVVDFLNFN
jgi:hypothetical protein